MNDYRKIVESRSYYRNWGNIIIPEGNYLIELTNIPISHKFSRFIQDKDESCQLTKFSILIDIFFVFGKNFYMHS